MFRPALRCSPRVVNSLRQSALPTSGRRLASTSAPNKKRSWKNSAARWALAISLVSWYSTSAVFAEEALPKTIQPPPQFSDDDLPTIEAVIAQKRREAEARRQKALLPAEQPTATRPPETPPAAPANDDETSAHAAPPAGSPEALEEEANQQGAFNPETGEINWDCPCLGGMAHGPCGEQFRAAFSCFVYSKEEPKGMDCIDKFQHMQDCFRLHPEVYGEELDDPDDDEVSTATPGDTAAAGTTAPTRNPPATTAPESETAETKETGSEENKVAGAEATQLIKETEKQNIPPAQP
ncbi:hypothetical protein GGS23DRAFT_601034 [Durotheca rogersii]|uniref:uncharacterized protein n=1 Tax=Durotheca rogersii TaxID=419775 RepID=UPI00221EE948|nr:uncharacterized protein GGS23DRAFT_601034 [Durotheca rogersii]KAI5856770.1 hypothetical protein GGS23DRAFT_601034 [Durotheca rogersii]